MKKNDRKMYGFYQQCKRKYSGSVNGWEYFAKTYLSAVISDKIFCVRGGLSPFLSSLDGTKNITKEKCISDPASDLLWSDPCKNEGWCKSSKGLGCLFGPDVAQQFNQKNNLDFISLVMKGFSWNSNNTVLTIWSHLITAIAVAM